MAADGGATAYNVKMGLNYFLSPLRFKEQESLIMDTSYTYIGWLSIALGLVPEDEQETFIELTQQNFPDAVHSDFVDAMRRAVADDSCLGIHYSRELGKPAAVKSEGKILFPGDKYVMKIVLCSEQ